METGARNQNRVLLKVCFVVLAIILMICIAVMVALAVHKNGGRKGDKSTEDGSYMLYVQDNTIYQLDCKTGSAVPIHDDEAARSLARYSYGRSDVSKISEDGRIVYYLVGKIAKLNSPSLYVVDQGADPRLISEDVHEYCISADGRYAVYITIDNSFYHYDLKKNSTTLLTDSCSSLFSTDIWSFPNGQYRMSSLYRLEEYVYFIDDTDLCRIAFGEEPELIAEGIREFDRNYIANNDLLCYVEGLEENAVGPAYLWRNGKKERCVDSASEIVRVYPDGSFYYIDGKILTKYEREVMGLTYDKKPTLCYYDGSKSTELFTYNDAGWFLFHPEIHIGILYTLGDKISDVDLYAVCQDEYILQKATRIPDIAVYEDALWYNSDSGLYKLSAYEKKLEKPELVLPDSHFMYRDSHGHFLAVSKDGILADGVLLAEYEAEQSLYCRMDELITMEAEHQEISFDYPDDPNRITYPFTTQVFAYTLSAWINGDIVEVAENVVVHFGMEDGTIVYISNMDGTTCTGDLYLYRDGKARLISQNVYGIVPCM